MTPLSHLTLATPAPPPAIIAAVVLRSPNPRVVRQVFRPATKRIGVRDSFIAANVKIRIRLSRCSDLDPTAFIEDHQRCLYLKHGNGFITMPMAINFYFTRLT